MKNRCAISKITVNSGKVHVAGRIISARKMKNFSFCNLRDASGEVQLLIRAEASLITPSIGDVISAQGSAITTNTGQLSVDCSSLEVLSDGSNDVANAFKSANSAGAKRQRSLDIMVDSDLRNMIKARSLLIRTIRNHFEDGSFLEVDTPVLSPSRFAGTATAFETQSRTLEKNLYLRGTLEDYLKQLVVAGFEKVFQVGDCFRNESPALIEFTMLEATWAYAKSEDMLEFIQQLITKICEQLPDELVNIEAKKGLSQKIDKVAFWDILKEYFNEDLRLIDKVEVVKLAKSEGYDFPETDHYDFELAKFGYEVIKHKLSKNFALPTFVGRFPACISPLAMEIQDGGGEADRGYGFFRGQRLFEVVMEANDYQEQHAKFQAQDDRSQRTQHSFKHDDLLTSLSYGCPPMAGLGFNINRVLAVLLNVERTSQVVPFPITSAALPL